MQYKFEDCVLDIEAHTLIRDGAEQSIEPQVFDFLHYLLQHPGKLISRDEMIDAVWGGRIVSESAVSARISALRRSVGDNGKEQAIIKTIARRGIQFVAEVRHGTAPARVAAPSPAGQSIRFSTANDGVKIAYAVSGDGPPLLRIGHLPSHLDLDWSDPTDRALFDRLGQYNTLIRMDLRGFGLSDIDIGDFSVERSARDAKTVADAAGLERLVVFGTSSGAMIAVQFAVMFPDMVSHLILQSGYVDGRSVRDRASGNAGQEIILNMAKEGWNTPGSAFVSGYLSVYMPTATGDQIKFLAEKLQASCPVENEIRGREFYNNLSIADILGDVRAPTLVLHSRGDAVHPLSEGQKLARGIADAQLVVLESRNHYPMPQEPSWQAQLDAMQEFLNG